MHAAIVRGRLAMACVVVACGVGCGGCGGGEPEGQPKGPSFRSQRGVRTIDDQASAPVQPEPSAAPARPLAPRPSAAPTEQPAPGGAPEEKPERDLGAELSTAVGSVTSCVKPRVAGSTGPTTLTASLEAVLTETGIVTRSSARGSGLDAEETECVRKRLDGARLAGPIEGAPRTVSTTITITLTAPPPAKPGDTASGMPGTPGRAPPATGSP